MLKGTYRHRIDPKGRLPVPAAFRRALTETGPATVVLTPLDDGDFLRAALVGHVVGRWSILPQSLLLPAARPDGAGALMRLGAVTTVVASAYTVAIALVAGRPAAGAVALGVGGLLTLAAVPVFRRTLGGATGDTFGALLTLAAMPVFRRTLGGATGDTFGALTKIVELACYAALVAMWA